MVESALRSRRVASKELGHVIMCAYRTPRAGIFNGRVLCRAAGYADVDTNSPAGQGFRARKVGIIRATAGPLGCVPPEVD